MILQNCSDLHLEFPQNEAYIKANPIKPIGDILILAGDVTFFTRVDKQKHFFDYISDRFELTYWIPGNYEYYQSDIQIDRGHLKKRSEIMCH